MLLIDFIGQELETYLAHQSYVAFLMMAVRNISAVRKF